MSNLLSLRSALGALGLLGGVLVWLPGTAQADPDYQPPILLTVSVACDFWRGPVSFPGQYRARQYFPLEELKEEPWIREQTFSRKFRSTDREVIIQVSPAHWHYNNETGKDELTRPMLKIALRNTATDRILAQSASKEFNSDRDGNATSGVVRLDFTDLEAGLQLDARCRAVSTYGSAIEQHAFYDRKFPLRATAMESDARPTDESIAP